MTLNFRNGMAGQINFWRYRTKKSTLNFFEFSLLVIIVLDSKQLIRIQLKIELIYDTKKQDNARF